MPEPVLCPIEQSECTMSIEASLVRLLRQWKVLLCQQLVEARALTDQEFDIVEVYEYAGASFDEFAVTLGQLVPIEHTHEVAIVKASIEGDPSHLFAEQ